MSTKRPRPQKGMTREDYKFFAPLIREARQQRRLARSSTYGLAKPVKDDIIVDFFYDTGDEYIEDFPVGEQ